MMLTSTLPFYHQDDAEVARKIREGDYDEGLLEREDVGEAGVLRSGRA